MGIGLTALALVLAAGFALGAYVSSKEHNVKQSIKNKALQVRIPSQVGSETQRAYEPPIPDDEASGIGSLIQGSVNLLILDPKTITDDEKRIIFECGFAYCQRNDYFTARDLGIPALPLDLANMPDDIIVIGGD